MKALKTAIVITMALFLLSCSTGQSKSSMGKYVYIDLEGVLHTKRDCPAVSSYKGGKSVDRYTLNDENLLGHIYGYCGLCVDDEVYDTIKKISEYEK